MWNETVFCQLCAAQQIASQFSSGSGGIAFLCCAPFALFALSAVFFFYFTWTFFCSWWVVFVCARVIGVENVSGQLNTTAMSNCSAFDFSVRFSFSMSRTSWCALPSQNDNSIKKSNFVKRMCWWLWPSPQAQWKRGVVSIGHSIPFQKIRQKRNILFENVIKQKREHFS